MIQVALSIGSNLDREYNVRFALRALAEHLEAIEFSPVYETASVGFDGPPFLNLVVGAKTQMTYQALCAWLKSIEVQAGRVLAQKAHANRVLDIDVLLYGDEDLRLEFNVPRDEIEKYAFVLKPLSDLYPDDIYPLTGLTFAQMWQVNTFQDQKLEQISFDFNPALTSASM